MRLNCIRRCRLFSSDRCPDARCRVYHLSRCNVSEGDAEDTRVKGPELSLFILRLGLVLVLGEQLDEMSVLLGTTNKQADALSRCLGMYDHAEHGIVASKLLMPLQSSFVVAGFAE